MKCAASFAATATVSACGIGVADVLRREANQAPRDVERVLAGLEHPRYPVDGRVRIAVAHRFVQRRDEVVVLLATLVVEQRAPLNGLLELRHVEVADARARIHRRRGRAANSSRFSAARASPLAKRAIAATAASLISMSTPRPRSRSAMARRRICSTAGWVSG